MAARTRLSVTLYVSSFPHFFFVLWNKRSLNIQNVIFIRSFALNLSRTVSEPPLETLRGLRIRSSCRCQHWTDNCLSAGFLYYEAGLIVQMNPFKIISFYFL
jgi:hypothetical protein